jgi:hypothetical protein
MKWIALLSLICLVGGASAQATFTGEGYSSSQLAFFNGPSTTPFEPFVEKYWNSYIHNSQNITGITRNPATTMNIWFNTFPLSFSQAVQLKSSTFNTGVPVASKYNSVEWNSMQLNRDTLSRFNIDQSWKYSQIYAPSGAQKSSFSLIQNESTSASDTASSGQIISQGIKALFNY